MNYLYIRANNLRPKNPRSLGKVDTALCARQKLLVLHSEYNWFERQTGFKKSGSHLAFEARVAHMARREGLVRPPEAAACHTQAR